MKVGASVWVRVGMKNDDARSCGVGGRALRVESKWWDRIGVEFKDSASVVGNFLSSLFSRKRSSSTRSAESPIEQRTRCMEEKMS